MKLGETVLFHGSRGEEPVPAFIVGINEDDTANLKAISNDDNAYMTFHPNVPKASKDREGYFFEARGRSSKKKTK